MNILFVTTVKGFIKPSAILLKQAVLSQIKYYSSYLESLVYPRWFFHQKEINSFTKEA